MMKTNDDDRLRTTAVADDRRRLAQDAARHWARLYERFHDLSLDERTREIVQHAYAAGFLDGGKA